MIHIRSGDIFVKPHHSYGQVGVFVNASHPEKDRGKIARVCPRRLFPRLDFVGEPRCLVLRPTHIEDLQFLRSWVSSEADRTYRSSWCCYWPENRDLKSQSPRNRFPRWDLEGQIPAGILDRDLG